MELSGVFWKILDAAKRKPRYISNCGGARSTKTYSTLQFLYMLIPTHDKSGDVTSVVSETMPHLKRGAIRDFENIVGHPLKDDDRWNASDCVFTFRNGAKLEFFSADASGKVLGPQRKRLFLNEGNHIPYETFRQLAVRTSGVIFIDYNPAASCWINEKVEPRDNCVRIHSTWEDNPFLTDEQKAEILANKTDANWWKVYGLGQFGSLDGVIYNFEQIDTLPEGDHLTEVWGIDFGFQDPTAIVQVRADHRKKEAYIRQIAYRPRMGNADIADVLKAQDIGRNVDIWADAAEPKSIHEIATSTGLRVKACDKSAPVKSDKRKFQIQWMQGWKLFITKDSVELIRDFRNYTWDKDVNGNFVSTPIHTFSHGPDSLRYALYTEFAGKENKGSYSFGFTR